MEKLIETLDKLFAKYNVTEQEIAEIGEIIAGLAGGELNNDGETFEAPDMGEADVYEEEDDNND